MLGILICMGQMAWMKEAQSRSLLEWVRDSFEIPEPGRPAPRHATLHPPEVQKSSNDMCAQALGIPKVALLFLTTGDLYHENTWRLWFKSAGGVVPAQAMAKSVCPNDGQLSRLQAIQGACREINTTGVVDAQHLFSVYVHAPPAFRGYDEDSLWAGKLIQHRVQTSWGAHTLVEATRNLLWEAYRDPLNTRFLLVSESDLPIYDPFTLYQQVQAETRSRLDTCRHEKTSPWRWDPRMETARLRFYHWRKSPQWMSMIREHVGLVLNDEEVYRKFERHCWSAWDQQHQRWYRDCFSDEHYFATLLSVEERDEEGVCMARGVSYTEWEGNAAHPKSFGSHVIDADLIRRARNAPLTVVNQPTPPCDWALAVQAASTMFVPKEQALDEQLGVDLCGKMERQPPSFANAKMPETCFLMARKFLWESRDRIKDVFLQCGNGLNLLRDEVCLANGGRMCGSLWGRFKGIFSRDPC